MEELKKKIEELEYAKKAVCDILDHECWVDMKGIGYWGQRVEKLREEIKEML